MEANVMVARIDRRVLVERDALSFELFANVYGADWDDADRMADEQIIPLLAYAQEWDATVAALAAEVQS